MSNFLDKFNKDNYQEFLDEEKSEKSEQTVKKEVKQEEPSKAEEIEEVIEEIIEEVEQEESKEDETIEIEPNDEEAPVVSERKVEGPSRGNQEEVVIDTTFKKKKQRQRIILVAVSVAVVVTFGLTWFFVNRVKVADLVGMTYAEATSWAQKNKIKLEVGNEYSMEFDENVVMKQGQEPKTAIMKGKTLQITVSTGADPEEVVKLPDFTKMKQADIDDWIKKNKMKNVSVVQEFSKDVAKGSYIKTVIKDSAVTAEKFKRKDYAAIYVSKGEETFEKNIVVPNFKGKTFMEVEEWGKKNDIVIEKSEQASNTIEDGGIISQSIAADEKMAKKETLSIVVSTGKAIVIPNYAYYTKETAGEASQEGIMVVSRYRYSDSVGYGYLISQSLPAGATYSMKDNIKVELVYSKGLPYIPVLKGLTEPEIAEKFFEFQNEGANITYSTVYISSGCTRGAVVDSSKYSQYTGLEDHIVIYVSDGSGACSVDDNNPPADGNE